MIDVAHKQHMFLQGVPKETTSELTLKTCMEEIDRCYENNRAPYFLNMTGLVRNLSVFTEPQGNIF